MDTSGGAGADGQFPLPLRTLAARGEHRRYRKGVVVTRQTLREHIAANPEFAFELLARVIGRARLATQTVRNMALLDVYGRLAHLLDSLAQRQPDGSRRIPGRLTHQELANRIGCSREMVSRLMKDLQSGGHVALADDHLILTRSLPARW